MKEIRLKLKSFDYKSLNKTIVNINSILSDTDSFVRIIFMPSRILKFTVNKSPHVHKKSREQFEIRHYSRIIVVKSTSRIVNDLIKLEIEMGVDIEVNIK